MQYMSDLHLEQSSYIKLSQNDVKSPYLALAGDIGDVGEQSYYSFLEQTSELWKKVFIILGNHESYGRTLDKTKTLVEKVCSKINDKYNEEKVIFLDRHNGPYLLENNLYVLGCTFWSHIPESVQDIVHKSMSDYRQIRGFGTQTHNSEHEKDKKWLTDTLSNINQSNSRCIIITHHAPLMQGTSASLYERPTHLLRFAFASDQRDLISNYKDTIVGWIHGHTHYCHSSTFENVAIVSNQRGYSNEVTAFNVNSYLKVV